MCRSRLASSQVLDTMAPMATGATAGVNAFTVPKYWPEPRDRLCDGVFDKGPFKKPGVFTCLLHFEVLVCTRYRIGTVICCIAKMLTYIRAIAHFERRSKVRLTHTKEHANVGILCCTATILIRSTKYSVPSPSWNDVQSLITPSSKGCQCVSIPYFEKYIIQELLFENKRWGVVCTVICGVQGRPTGLGAWDANRDVHV